MRAGTRPSQSERPPNSAEPTSSPAILSVPAAVWSQARLQTTLHSPAALSATTDVSKLQAEQLLQWDSAVRAFPVWRALPAVVPLLRPPDLLAELLARLLAAVVARTVVCEHRAVYGGGEGGLAEEEDEQQPSLEQPEPADSKESDK